MSILTDLRLAINPSLDYYIIMKPLKPGRFFKALGGLLKGRVKVPPSLEDNPVIQVILQRRSIRKFEDREIPPDVMEAVLEAGRVAPCGVNLQTWSFGVYNREQWRELFGRPIPFGAVRAVLILGDANRVRQAVKEFPHKPLTEYTLAVMNASIASYAMNIAAEACGVASVMLSETGKTGFYDGLYLKEKLGFPDGVFPIMTIVFGYPAGKALGMPPKLPLSEITFTGRYRLPDPAVMQDWLEQMMAGYRAMYITKSFSDQLSAYNSRIDQTEEGLRKMIYYKDEEFKT